MSCMPTASVPTTRKGYKTLGQIFFWGNCYKYQFALCYGNLSVLSVCNVGVLWPNGWMDQDATWYGGRPRPGWYCVRWGPSSPHGKGHSSPHFLPMSIVAKRSPISATAELLFQTVIDFKWPCCCSYELQSVISSLASRSDWTCVNFLDKWIWKSSIQLDTNTCLYKSCRVPVLMYSCKTWDKTR